MSRLRVDEINDVDARSLAALSGEAHIVRQVSTQVSGQLERSRTMRLVTIPGIGTFSAYLNIQRPPFDDVLVRRALAWAVDREELVLQAIDGWGKGAPSWLAPNPFYPEAARVGYPKHDLAKAGQLLDEAGWRIAPGGRARAKNGVPLRFRVLWFGSNRPAAEVLQAQWSRLGAEVTVEGSTQYSFLQQKRAQNDWEILLESWGTLGDPAAVLARHLAPDGDLNYGRFSDPTTDALLAGFAGLYSPEERRLQALRVNERQAELVPFIPLYSSQGLTAVARTVRNFVVQPISQQQEVHPDLWVAA
jgi:peptide/nickel transport system substrate-binding protein